MKSLTRSRTFFVLLSLLLGVPATADDLFHFRISYDGILAVDNSNNSILKFVELFDNISLSQFPGYTPQSEVSALLNIRGLRGIASYAANSSELRLAFPELGLDVRFPGASRDESQEWFEEWIKGLKEIKGFASSTQLRDLLHAAVEYSPVDPVAGNPNSLQTRMFMNDYARAVGGPFVQVSDLPADATKPRNHFQLGINYGGAYQADRYDVNAIEINMGGYYNFSNRHWAWILDWPAMVTFSENAPSYFTYPGVGVQYRVNNWWDLTLFGRGGAAGSVQVGALAFMYSGTLTSYMRKELGKLAIGWGLLGGINRTINDVEIDDYNLTYGLENYPVRTGLDLTGPFGFRCLGKEAGWGLHVTHTHLFGSDLFLESFYEFGASFRLFQEDNYTKVDRLRFQVSYLYGDDYDGVNAGVAFNF